MVTINHNIYPSGAITGTNANATSKSTSSNDFVINHLDITSIYRKSNEKNSIFNATANYYFEDVPLLDSDHEEYTEDDDISSTKSNYSYLSSDAKASVTAEKVKRSMKNTFALSAPIVPSIKRSAVPSPSNDSSFLPETISKSGSRAAVYDRTITESSTSVVITKDGLTIEEFKYEKNQLMIIIVKYMATKILNSFPPDSLRKANSSELPLDKFLLILTARLNLTLPLFMKGIIYLFRYMDIVYLLRYLNQSNNFANYNEMGYCLKKLLVGCFKIALSRENITKNWYLITGLSNENIDTISESIINRMNGKLTIKPIELIKLKLEIFRFVKMVTNEI